MATLALLAALALAAPAQAEAAGPPHVILISIDTLRRDALAALSSEAGALPALDRLAAEGVRFANAFSSSSWTLPAHASLLTGLYPDKHGATDRRTTLAEGVATLAETLAGRGYETVALTGTGFLQAKFGLGRGFARHEYVQAEHKQEPAESGQALRGRLTTYLAGRSAGQPLFLFLHSYAVHNYFDARAEALARLGTGGASGLKQRKLNVDCLLGRTRCPSDSWDQMRALYRSELELFDAALADMRAELERAGLWQNAIVVLLSDHGEGFDPTRQRIHHSGRLHADQLRIPLLVRGPGLAPREERTPVSIVDLMPTLLELVGAPVPAGLDGISLAASLRSGQAPAARPLLAMEHYFLWVDGRREMTPEVRPLPRELAVIDGRGCFITSERGDELYALDDLEQRNNLLTGAEQAARYRALLGARPLPRPSSEAPGEDEELRQALDGLGYGGGD